MRGLLIVLGLLLSGAAQAQIVPSIIFRHSGNTLPGATVDLNFATQQFLPSAALSQITETRNSIATQDGLDGTWYQFSPGQFRLTSKGHLHEEARTDGIPNSTANGGGVGVTPTGWLITSGNGVTCSSVGVGVESGINYDLIQCAGTTTALTNLAIYFNQTYTTIPAAQNQVWSMSVFSKLVSGSMGAPVAPMSLVVGEVNSSGVLIQQDIGSVLSGGTNALGTQRTSTSVLLSNAATAYVQLYTNIQYAASTAVNFTIEVGWPQLELNANATTAAQGFATSPIPTTAGAVTRQADSTTMPLPAGACNAAGCSLWAQFTPISPPIYPMYREPAQVDDGTNNNRVFLSEFTASGFGFYGEAISSVLTTQNISTAFSQNIQSKAAMFATATGFQPMQNGVLGTITSVAGPAAVSKLRIGGGATGSYCDCYIQRIAVGPTSLLGD